MPFWSDIVSKFVWNWRTWQAVFFNSREAIAAIIGDIVDFYNSKNLNCIGARCLCFKDVFSHFHDFWSQIGIVILLTPKQEVERKSEWFLRRKIFFALILKWENGVWTKIRFLASGFLFTCMRQFQFDVYCFTGFFGLDFLKIVFSTHPYFILVFCLKQISISR